MKNTMMFVMIALHGVVGNAQWVQLSGGLPSAIYYSVMTDGSNIYAGNNSQAGQPKLFRSTNNGDTWVPVSGIPSSHTVWSLESFGPVLFAGSFGFGGYRSTNGGTDWHLMDSGLTQSSMPRGFSLNSSFIFAGTWDAGVYRSTDNGTSWTSASNGLSGGGLWPILATSTYVFVGFQTGGVFRTTNNGLTWVASNNGLTNTTAYALEAYGNSILVGTGGSGVFRSTNYGNSWTPSSTGLPAGSTIYALERFIDTLIAGTANMGAFASTDGGSSWTSINSGLTNPQVFSLAVNTQFVFAGTTSAVFRRSVNQLSVGVPTSKEHPAQFELSQNHPNPFNPTTTVSFSVPHAGMIALKVLDILGREIASLADGNHAPGTYQATWDASGLPSGVYFCRLEAGEYSVTNKMLLIR